MYTTVARQANMQDEMRTLVLTTSWAASASERSFSAGPYRLDRRCFSDSYAARVSFSRRCLSSSPRLRILVCVV